MKIGESSSPASASEEIFSTAIMRRARSAFSFGAAAAAAADLLPSIAQPTLIEDMLIQKRFAALWPRLTELAGPHLGEVRERSVAVVERAYSEQPDDHRLLQYYANALRRAGHLEDAVKLRANLPQTTKAMGSADEQMGWAVNNVALALHAAGRSEEADRLFASLNEAGSSWWRVSMVINRLELLVTDGKFERAAALLASAEQSASRDGSPYAQQLVRRLKYCVLAKTGRASEAAKLRGELLEKAKDAYVPTIDALLCADDVDTAEKIAVEALNAPAVEEREEFERQFVRALQPQLLTSDDPSIWQGRWDELRKRQAIAVAYQRLGRDMPKELLPK